MAKKPIYHAVLDVHVHRTRKKVREQKLGGRFGTDIVNKFAADRAMCNYYTRIGESIGTWSERKSVVRAAKCWRQVNCKLCLRSKAFKRAHPPK